MIIQGIVQRCTLIEKCQSNDLAAQWLNKTNDRTDQTVPMSATELKIIDILVATTVEHAEFIKTWTKMSRGEQIAMTPPTIASSVPATAAFGVHRADSLPAPQGAPRVYTPRRATQAPQLAPPTARVLQTKGQRTRSPRNPQRPPPHTQQDGRR